ncbi:hypothetical protein Tco_0240876 [Tanacetum coccineum]
MAACKEVLGTVLVVPDISISTVRINKVTTASFIRYRTTHGLDIGWNSTRLMLLILLVNAANDFNAASRVLLLLELKQLFATADD